MSLTKINLNMIQTPLSGVLGGSNSTVNHNSAFVIGDDISTTHSDALYVNDLRASGKIYGDGSTIDNIGVAFTTEMWTNVSLSGYNVTNTPALSASNKQITNTEFVKFTVTNALTGSPSLSGIPTAPIAPTVGLDNQIANRHYTNNIINYKLSESPALGGLPTTPTVSVGEAETQAIASIGYVTNYIGSVLNDSPSLGGTPTTSTPSTNTIDSSIASTEFVNNFVQYVLSHSPSLSGEPVSVTPPISAYGKHIATTEFVKNLGYLSAADRSLTDNLTQTPQYSLVLGKNSLVNESSFSSSVSSNLAYSSTSDLVTITLFEDHGVSVGDYISTTNDTLSSFNGTFRVLVVNGNDISFENSNQLVQSGSISAINNSRINLAIGQQSLNSLSTGKSNLAIGFDAGSLVTTTNNNVSIGNNSQGNNGSVSLGVSTSANNLSIAAGNFAVAYNKSTTLGHETTAGLSAVSIGYKAGATSSNIAIGTNAQAYGNAGAIVIGTNAAASGNHLVLATSGVPLNSQTATEGRLLELKLNDTVGYVPVYTNTQLALPVSIKDDRSTISSDPTTGTINYNVISQTNLYHLANATGNFTLNVRGDGSTTLNSILNSGESVTIRFYYVNGASAYSNTELKIDGAQQSIYWLNNATPTPLTRSINYYQYTIIKTGASTYNAFGSFGNFADSDANFSNVSLLLHADGTQGSSSFSDSSNNNLSVTASGNAQIDTIIKKFGTGSAKFDGNGDYLSLAPTNLFDFGTGAFTIEFWVYIGADNNQTLVLINGDGSNPGLGGVRIGLDSSRNVLISMKTTASGSWDFDSGAVNANLNLNTWHHLAVTRDGSGSIKFFKDGTLTYSNTWAGSILSNATTYIGALNNSSSYYTGYLDDLRITKGIARYSSNFTAPSTPFPNQ